MTATLEEISDLIHRLEGLEAVTFFANIFAADERDCTHTNLVPHDVDTANMPPIRQQPQHLPFAKRAKEKLQEMHAAGAIGEPMVISSRFLTFLCV